MQRISVVMKEPVVQPIEEVTFTDDYGDKLILSLDKNGNKLLSIKGSNHHADYNPVFITQLYKGEIEELIKYLNYFKEQL